VLSPPAVSTRSWFNSTECRSRLRIPPWRSVADSAGARRFGRALIDLRTERKEVGAGGGGKPRWVARNRRKAERQGGGGR